MRMLMLVTFLLSLFPLTVFAQVSPVEYETEMMFYVNEQLKNEYESYKEGTLRFTEIKGLQDAQENRPIIIAGIGEFTTMKDVFIPVMHKELFYYSAASKKLLTKDEVSMIQGVSPLDTTNYDLGAKVSYAPIGFLLTTLLCFIVLLIVFLEKVHSPSNHPKQSRIA